MTFLGICLSGLAAGASAHHNTFLTALSYLVAAFASFTALQMTERFRRAEGRARESQVGIEPVIVENGQDVVKAWAEGDWALILMDIQMPMDGVDATRAIRLQEMAHNLPRTPIVALTANAMAHHIAEYGAAGMDGHVSKPIQAAQLFAVIDADADRVCAGGA